MSHVAGGCSTYSKREFIHLPHYPKQIVDAQGSYVWDEDAQQFIDFTASLGAIILGYEGGLGDHYCLPLPHESEELAAEVLCEATGWEQVRWCKNGSDATEAAVRVARFVTGNQTVLCNSYHGSHDSLVTATPNKGGGVVQGAVGWIESYSTPEELLDRLNYSYSVAAVIMEPVTWDRADWRLAEIKRACEKAGAFLIFDEMITGFRSRPGSIVDVKPDLACYGKAIGNGAPIACVAGNKEYMHHFESNVFMSGTYACEVASLERCFDTVSYLASEEGAEGYRHLAVFSERLGTALVGVARGYYGRHHIDLPKEKHELFVDGLAKRGILVGRDFFLTHAHSDEDIANCVEAIKETRAEVGV